MSHSFALTLTVVTPSRVSTGRMIVPSIRPYFSVASFRVRRITSWPTLLFSASPIRAALALCPSSVGSSGASSPSRRMTHLRTHTLNPRSMSTVHVSPSWTDSTRARYSYMGSAPAQARRPAEHPADAAHDGADHEDRDDEHRDDLQDSRELRRDRDLRQGEQLHHDPVHDVAGQEEQREREQAFEETEQRRHGHPP